MSSPKKSGRKRLITLPKVFFGLKLFASVPFLPCAIQTPAEASCKFDREGRIVGNRGQQKEHHEHLCSLEVVKSESDNLKNVGDD